MGRIVVRRFRGTESQQRNYVRSLNNVLDTIRQSRTGRILLRHIDATPYPILIYPYWGQQPNAITNVPHLSVSGTTDNGTRARGARVEIAFHPIRSADSSPGGSAHECLFHELAHAYRALTGSERHVLNGSNRDDASFGFEFESIEELFSVILTNIYSSELGLPMRLNHDTEELTNRGLVQQWGFREQYRIMYNRMPEAFISDISNIPKTVASFNPFADIRLHNDTPYFDHTTYNGAAENVIRRGILISTEEAFMEFDWQQHINNNPFLQVD